MNLSDKKDKAIALIVWNTEKEEEVSVFLYTLQVNHDEYYIVNEEKGWRISLTEEQLSRLKPVSEDLKEILLNADYSLSMSMGEMPEFNPQEYRATGMIWKA